MNVRMAKVEDAKDLLNIYEYYVTNTPITFEYDVPTIEEFKNRIETTLKRYPYIVAEENGKIYGYAYAGHLNVDAPMTGLLKHQYMYNTKIPVKEWEHCFIMN